MGFGLLGADKMGMVKIIKDLQVCDRVVRLWRKLL